ncbi:MAG: hypothetical protein KJ749_11200 [Planctomycetes bacterium]|nr:hypothetical protein [Planctomycetota bacterium]
MRALPQRREFIEVFTVNKNPTAQELRKFGWAMLFGFGGLGLLLWLAPWVRGGGAGALAWSGRSGQITAVCFWVVSLTLGVVGVSAANVARPVYVLWMSVAAVLGIAVSTIMLTLLYFLLLPVFALVVRWGDPLRKKKTQSDTFWEDHEPYEATLDRMARMF